jgi:hypothetical protein
MELLCALLTGFFLWLFVFHLLSSRRRRAREEIGPLLLEVKASPRIVRSFRWAKGLGVAVVLVGVAANTVLVYRLNTIWPEFLSLASYTMNPSILVAWLSFMLPTFVTLLDWRGTALKIGSRGILFASGWIRLWSEVAECRWFTPKTAFGVLLCRWTPWRRRRSRLTIHEKNIAPGQKEAITATLARFVPVYDHDGTLLAGPAEADAAARAALPARPRLWLQFDLQALLLLVVVVSCAASCYGIHCRRVLPQRQALAQLKPFDPAMGLFEEIPWSLDFSKSPKKPADDDLSCLEPLDQLDSLDLSGSPITDAGLEHLKRLRRLTYINCTGTKVTAKGAEGLHRLLPNATIIYGPAKHPVVLKPADKKQG